ncbi:hypothetical protein Cfor_02931, partial [Coptotermes formosanus]
PRILAQDGNLLLFSGLDRNITLHTSGRGYVNLNSENLALLAKTARAASETVERIRTSVLVTLEQDVQTLSDAVLGSQGLQIKVASVERTIRNGTMAGIGSPTWKRVTTLNRRVTILESQVRQLRTLLTTDECASNPCHNGGTCIDSYSGFFCRCPSNWEGLLCNVDVNECAHFAGTDLGCQNGATCINKPGTYECVCASGWYGVHCVQQSDDCLNSTPEERCGHGTCVNQKTTGGRGYKCICDQGWTTHGATGACVWDVDECSSNTRPACSVNPLVQCINVPGSFYCGACPQGYTGNGFYCSDIDECQMNNGGCSVSPLVQCINTQGSRVCGQCPPGYQGDGQVCTFLGVCAVNNGGCHPLARCLDNPRISQSYVECICPSGYVGSGVGPAGCVPTFGGGGTTSRGVVNPCDHVHCVNGNCIPNFAGAPVCVCYPGYTGNVCNVMVDSCSSQPCQNSGTCVQDGATGYHCVCAEGYTGSRCEEEEQSCGGVLTGLSGRLQYPHSGSIQYGHNVNCAWLITTNTTKVLQLNFTKFDVEHSPNCEFDFLQIHDGRSAGAHMLGRYCNSIPNITSTHNKIYLWFRTDHSNARNGFALTWNSTDPVCGSANAIVFSTHGTLSSPGSPGRYPNNRDCFWTLLAPYNRRIQFHFFTMQIEASANCSNDYLEILSGWNMNQIAVYCNTSHPRPLTVPGNQAIVHFHTNAAVNDAGFQLSYSSIEGFPGCGGVLTAPSGDIYSPNHPDRYRANMDCEWHIQLPVGERIRVTFLTFSLEVSAGCYFDSVSIRTGVDLSAPIVGRYCGNQLPSPYTSVSNELVIHFTSDWSFAGEGFHIKYEALCGGVFSAPSAVLKSPFYPNSYPANRICVYEIELPPGQAVELCFQDFEVEDTFSPPCRYDYLEIRDGHDENSTLLGQYCGGQDQFPTPCITSQYNILWLKFKTDGSVSNRGFYANYSSIGVECGGILKQQQGTIQSPNYPLYYSGDHICRWVIVGAPGTVVQLTWQSFHLEGSGYNSHCPYDTVVVFDNSSVPEYGGVMGTFCGDTLPPVLTTTDNVMTVIFTTDSSASREGFSATYTTLDSSTMCGGTYFTSKGILQSPNYPNYYPHNKDCTWIISVPTGQQIKLNITDFRLEGSGTRCPYDYLEIRNGGSQLAPLIGRYCGTSIPTSIPSMSNQLFLRFVSDRSGRRTGFRITWDGTATGCGGTLTAPTGSIISPNYPQPYGHSGECFWRISVSRGSVIQVVFVDIELESHPMCMHDYVEVYDGKDASSRKIGRYCTSTPLTLRSTSDHMFIKFRSDMFVSGRGFHIHYQTDCNAVVRGFSGVIESPNFPSEYPDSLDCTWNITAPRGNKINATFSHFELEDNFWLWGRRKRSSNCSYDYVEVQEGADNAAPDTVLMSKRCGSEIPGPVHSSKNHVYVHFVTDSSRTYPGFRLEWVVDGCGGILRKPSGKFTSPGYPVGYPHNTVCEWTITVDWGHSVELTIEDLSMHNVPNCVRDSLTIYSGTDASGPQLSQMCHADKGKVLTSSGNSIFVRFESDMAYSGKGFGASYRTVDSKCGGKFTASKGSIHSPNYPNNYDANLDCLWLIEVDKNFVIWFVFTDFDLNYSQDCENNFVKVYDGNSTNSTQLFFDCSNNLPALYNFTSSGNQLLIHMRTSSIFTAKGFHANYTLACGARIMAEDTGILTTHSSIISYESHNCSWIITAPNPEDRVTLTITVMDLAEDWSGLEACPYYRVEVRDGDDAEAPLIGIYCGSRAPPHLTTQGSAMFVQVMSLWGGSVGTFTAVYSVLSSACGGNLSSEHGSFASPGYPNNYPMESECVWYIGTSPGNRVLVSFSLFELETSEFCNEDYVELRRESAAGPVIGVYCGTDIPSNITAAHSIWVRFQSSGTGTARGFIADYSMLHGNDLSGRTGQVASPLYPRSYMRDGVFSWRIMVDFGQAVAISFKEFFVDDYFSDCYSYVAIYDGFDETAPTLFKECKGDFPDPVTSSSNVVYVVFASHPIRLGSKFLLEWLQVNRQISSVSVPPPTIPGCGGLISLQVGGNHSSEKVTFTSPGYPEGYADMLHCEWIFETAPGNHLGLRFSDMDLEQSDSCYIDYVQVYRGRRGLPDWRLMKTLCMPNATRGFLESTNLMKVVFNTDFYVNRTGFKGTVEIVCGGMLTEPNGVIDMQNETRALHWFYTYGHLQCEWNVTVKVGRTIAVEFPVFNVPSIDTAHCAQNYIVLRNGRSRLSPMLGQGRYCGTQAPANIPETSGNELSVTFVGLSTAAVFKLVYREVSVACGGRILLSAGDSSTVIMSPRYPNVPPPHTECEWIIMAPAGERLHLEFVERFDITYSQDCRQAFVELRDGATVNSELINTFCKEMPSSQYTRGNMLYVRFFTDVTDPKNGFKANVSLGKIHSSTCGGTIRGNKGRVTSPSYPGQYPNNLDCTWKLIGPPDHYLVLWFDELSMPYSPYSSNCTLNDYVAVTEQMPFNSSVNELATYCGSSPSASPSFNSTSNEVTVVFHSDGRSQSYGVSRGFSLRFNASQEVCGGLLEGPTGVFESPGYPSTQGYRRYCKWEIVVPAGRRVKVELLDFDLESSVEAYRHRLIFYDGPKYSLYLRTFHATNEPEVVRSTSNRMLVIFISYHNVGHRGFRARYTSDEPSPCVGDLNGDSGYVYSPARSLNLVSFHCEWERSGDTAMNKTIAFTLLNGTISKRGYQECYYNWNAVWFTTGDDMFLGHFCGNYTSPTRILSPYMNVVMKATQASGGRVDFMLQYSTFDCGGLLSGPVDMVTSPVASNGKYPPNSACAWVVTYPAGSVINVTFVSMRLESDCNHDYLLIRNGPRPLSPLMNKYCGTDVPMPILSQSNALWIEFYSDDSNEDEGFVLRLEAVFEGCGGMLQTRGSTFTTPKYPGKYPPNTECTWDIKVKEGYFVTLSFLERFDVEQSTGCSQDFVEVFDYVDDAWVSLQKLCGRDLPPLINSTGFQMRVLFHSNAVGSNNGFKATFDVQCGSVITNKSSGHIMSPGFPMQYDNNLQCNYTIVFPDRYINLEFTSFDLE